MNGIDHLMSVVPDLAAAADTVRRLGFTVTDRGVHAGRGTSNHLIVLPGCYWELLAVDEPTPVNARVREALAHPGLFGCALATQDVASDRLRTEAAGLPTDMPVGFVRPVEIDGAGHDAGFRTAHIRPREAFDGYFFFCQHLTPELVWRDAWMRHDNGALRITGADVSAADPNAAGALLARIFGAAYADDGEGGALTLDRLRLCVTAGLETAEPRFSALRIGVRDRDALAASIWDRGFSVAGNEHAISVRAAALGDMTLVLERTAA